MLTNLLPGLREIRAPLISGYLWLVFFFLAFHGDLPTRHDADPTLMPLFDLGHDLSALGIATVSGVAAYLVGSAVQELLKLMAQLPPGQPFYAEAGTHLSVVGRFDVERAVNLQVQAIQRRLFQVALSPGERGVDEEPSPQVVEKELPLIRTLLLGDHPDLVGELDRLQAEADLRITVAAPIVAFAGLFCFSVSVGWLLALLPAGLLLAQGFQRQVEVGDLLAKALRIGKVNAPSLESLDASATAAIERIELEEDLARKVRDERSPMAAFRLGNLQASGEDYEAAVRSLRFAAENEVFRAYAEVGFVYEALGQDSEAEQAYRDGEQRRDRRSTERLARLLRRLRRDEEALATESRSEEAEERRPRKPTPKVPEDRNRISDYERRMAEGDGKAAINLGLLRQRRNELEKSIAAFESATRLNEEDAQAWLALGKALRRANRAAEAERAFERARALLELNLGGEHLEVAGAIAGLGAAKNELGDYDAAQELLERALRIQEKEVGDDTVDVAFILGGLAIAHGSRGDLEQASELEDRALRIEERELGSDNPAIGITLQNLAFTALRAGRYVEAEEMLERAVSLQENDSDAAGYDLAYSLDTLGVFSDTVGSYREGLELHERAISIKQENLPSDHVSVLTSQVYRAMSLHGLGRYEEARDTYQRAIPLLQEAYGPSHLQLVEPLVAYAVTLNALEEANDARVLAEHAVEIVEAATHPNPRLRADALAVVGAAMNALGSFNSAAAHLAEALGAKEMVYGADHLYLVMPLIELGDAEHGRQRVLEARDLYLRALGILGEAPVTHYPAIGIARRGLAGALMKLGDFDQAEFEARESLVSLEGGFGRDHPEIATTLDLLAQLLDVRGDAEQAAAARGRAASIRSGSSERQEEG
jgi:tetratricopeptide (TPR) repeat protein